MIIVGYHISSFKFQFSQCSSSKHTIMLNFQDSIFNVKK